MRRKTPKSHPYTIAALALVVSASAFLAWGTFLRENPEATDTQYATNPGTTIPLNVDSNADIGNLQASGTWPSIQNQNLGSQLQSAGNARAFSVYEAGQSGSYQPQHGQSVQ